MGLTLGVDRVLGLVLGLGLKLRLALGLDLDLVLILGLSLGFGLSFDLALVLVMSLVLGRRGLGLDLGLGLGLGLSFARVLGLGLSVFVVEALGAALILVDLVKEAMESLVRILLLEAAEAWKLAAKLPKERPRAEGATRARVQAGHRLRSRCNASGPYTTCSPVHKGSSSGLWRVREARGQQQRGRRT